MASATHLESLSYALWVVNAIYLVRRARLLRFHGAFPTHTQPPTPRKRRTAPHRQALFVTCAFKICEAASVQPTHTQWISTFLPAVLLAARPGSLA